MYASGYFDPEKLGTRAGTLRKDAAQSKDLMMRDLEIKELKQEKNYLQKELSNAKESAEKLQKQLREHLSRPQAPPALAASAGDKQQIMNFYLEQISTLDQDNKLLREELAKAQTTLAIQSQQKQADREFDLGSDGSLSITQPSLRRPTIRSGASRSRSGGATRRSRTSKRSSRSRSGASRPTSRPTTSSWTSCTRRRSTCGRSTA